MENASDESRMAAIIRCVLHIEPNDLTEEEFYRSWGQAKYFMSIAYQIKWNG